MLLTTKGETPHLAFRFAANDVLMLGRESAGVPAEVHAAADARIVIPLVAGQRSLNIAVAAAIGLGEALRQTGGFAGWRRTGGLAISSRRGRGGPTTGSNPMPSTVPTRHRRSSPAARAALAPPPPVVPRWLAIGSPSTIANGPTKRRNLVDEITAAGGSAMAVAADVGSEADVVRLFIEAERRLGPITALVNNAGIVGPALRVDEVSAERLERMFRVNVIGSFIAAREAVKRMSTRHGGTGGAIVNISSAASRIGGSGEYVDYAASKGAIDTFTLGLAQGGCRGGYPRQRHSAGTDLHGYPCLRRRAGAGRAAEVGDPDEARRHRRRSRGGHRLAVVGRGLLLHRGDTRRQRRPLTLAQRPDDPPVPVANLPIGSSPLIVRALICGSGPGGIDA